MRKQLMGAAGTVILASIIMVATTGVASANFVVLPEPGTVGLSAIGIAAVAIARLRRKNR